MALSNNSVARKSSTRLSQRDQRTVLEEEFIVAEIDSENHLNSESESSFRYSLAEDQPLAEHSIVEIVSSPVVALPNNQAGLPATCNCSRSLALSKLSAMSLAMPVYERHRFESGLLQFAEDFM